jgi:maltooligosyltrehalose trehalohydrolase
MTPLLFMGQEWASSNPFLYFTDHDQELGRRISEGRRREFEGFGAFSENTRAALIPDPQALETFEGSKLDWERRDQGDHGRALELHRAALELRRTDRVLRDGSRERLSADAFGDVLVVECWHGGERRVLVVNFGAKPVAFEKLPPIAALSNKRMLLSSASVVDEGSIAPHVASIFANG